MALVENPFYTLSLQFQDRDLNKASTQLYVAPTVLVADIITALSGTITGTVAALSDASLVGWSLSRSAGDTAPALAGEASDVERKGVFTFRGDNNRPVTLQVPSIKNTLVVDRTDKINTTDAAVAAFIAMITSGAVLGAVRPLTVTGADITAFFDAYKKHRGSARG